MDNEEAKRKTANSELPTSQNSDDYHNDNSFNDNGINIDSGDENFNGSNSMNQVSTFGKGLASGVKNGSNGRNPALGLKNNKNKNTPNKNKGNTDNKNKGNNPDRENSNKKNPLPGGGTNKNKGNNPNNSKQNENNKGPQSPKNTNNANNNDGKQLGRKNNGTGLGLSRLNPLNRLKNNKQDNKNNKDKENQNDVVAPNLNEMKQKGIRALWMIAPIQVKIIAISLIPLMIIALLIFLAIFGGTAAGLTGLMCSSDGSSGSTYNGEDYSGSGDEKEFLCKMQNPLGKKFSYTITSKPGPRWGSTHHGIDLAIGRGTPVYAVQSGVVTETHDGCFDANTHTGDQCGWTMGNYVRILHGGKIETHYYHMINGSIKVKKGDKVGKGQLIGNVASSGNSSGNHLHFGMKINNKLVYGYVDYFLDYEGFKKNCGSMWDGEPAGDSANAANDTSDYESSGSITSEERCCDSSGTSGNSADYCSNGITVSGVGTLKLDDYVAGVVSRENSYYDGDNLENMKAQAIASRTYAVNATKNCSSKIENSTSAQVFTENPNEKAKKAADETSGMLLRYDGKVFSSMYDAFCINDTDCPDAKCNGTTCTATYTRLPNKETHKITINSPHSKTVVNGSLNGKGHAYGMSQLVARQMQDEGKKFDEILKYFYSDGVEITGSSNTCVLGKNSFNGKIWVYYQTDYQEPYGSYGTIATHGCGPTSMAIVASSLLNEKHDPVELTNFACSNNYCREIGTVWEFFTEAGKKYGLKVKTVDVKNSDEVLIALNKGNALVIASMGPGTFTKNGHFIVLTGSDGKEVMVQDPSGKKNSKKWNFDKVIVPEASGFWIITK